MANKNLQLTSVKVKPEDFDEFKILCVRTKFNLQKLVHVAMDQYINNDEFRSFVHNPHLSGSFSL